MIKGFWIVEEQLRSLPSQQAVPRGIFLKTWFPVEGHREDSEGDMLGSPFGNGEMAITVIVGGERGFYIGATVVGLLLGWSLFLFR